MKTKFVLTSRILALALFAATPCAFAQTAVPNSMSYQGRISDASGNLVGNPTPVNRTVIFRVWDNPTATGAANLLYSEQQVVTIASGEFNVLVGQGSQVGTEPKPAFDSVFNGAQRFLGVTVDDGTAAADPEITPRQQLVTSAFAFRAKTAEGVPANAITSSMLAAGAVTANSIGANAIDSTKLAAGAVNAASIAANAIDSSKLAAGAVTGTSIAANAIDSTKLDSTSIGLWSVSGGNVFRGSGNVGIGMGTPAALFQLHSTTQLSERMRISGASYTTTVPGAPTDGVSFLMGANAANSRQLWLADSTQLTPNATNSVLRFLLGQTIPVIDALATDGATYKNLAICPIAGNVGIRTQTPVQATLHVEGSGFFSSQCIAQAFTTISDARVKSIVGRSVPHSDLESVRKLQVTNYRMIDRKDHGDAVQKGFIAQEVQQVVPEAVKKLEKRAIPSINASAMKVTFDTAAKTVRIVMEKAHGLKKGDTVQVSDDNRSFDLLVSQTTDATSFVAGPVEAPMSKVFVYGKVVEDFLSVDYNRLFTTGIGAIQELALQVDALKAENAELRTRLAAIEKVLSASGSVAVTAAAEKKDRSK